MSYICTVQSTVLMMPGRSFDLRRRNPKVQHCLYSSPRVTRSMATSSLALKKLSVFKNDVNDSISSMNVYDAKYSGILANVPENEKMELHLVSAIASNTVIPTPIIETLNEKEYEDLYGVAFYGMPQNLITEDDRGKNFCSTIGDPPLPEVEVMKCTSSASKPFTILLKKFEFNEWQGHQDCTWFRVVRDMNCHSVVPYSLGEDAKMLRINVK